MGFSWGEGSGQKLQLCTLRACCSLVGAISVVLAVGFTFFFVKVHNLGFPSTAVDLESPAKRSGR